MPRSLSTNNATGVALDVTRPIYLLDMGFSTPMRLSSRETMTYDGNSYTAANIEVNLSPPNPTVRIWNDQLAYGSIFIAQGTQGISVTLYVLYGETPFSPGDADTFWDGELGPATLDEWIEVGLLPHRPQYCPKIMANDDIFSHLPPHGTEFQTLAGTIYLINRES